MFGIPSEYNILLIVGSAVATLLLVRVAQTAGRRRRERQERERMQERVEANTARRIQHEKVAPHPAESNRRVGFRRKKGRRSEPDRRTDERRVDSDEAYTEADQRSGTRRASGRRKDEDRREDKRRDWDRE